MGGASLTPIRRTDKQNPLNSSGFCSFILGSEMKQSTELLLVFTSKEPSLFYPFTLSVVFNQVLHELGVAKVDGACVVLVQSGDLGHLVGCKREVEDVEVLLHALLVA